MESKALMQVRRYINDSEGWRRCEESLGATQKTRVDTVWMRLDKVVVSIACGHIRVLRNPRSSGPCADGNLKVSHLRDVTVDANREYDGL